MHSESNWQLTLEFERVSCSWYCKSFGKRETLLSRNTVEYNNLIYSEFKLLLLKWLHLVLGFGCKVKFWTCSLQSLAWRLPQTDVCLPRKSQFFQNVSQWRVKAFADNLMIKEVRKSEGWHAVSSADTAQPSLPVHSSLLSCTLVPSGCRMQQLLKAFSWKLFLLFLNWYTQVPKFHRHAHGFNL